jgi:uncharacterized protein DUF6970
MVSRLELGRQHMKPLRLTLAIMLALVAGCARPTQSENPEWVDQLITQFQREPVGNPPQSIWRYEFDGQVVYYVPAQCCDMFSALYDEDGQVVCAPDGGIDGRGDQRCPDFRSQRTDETLIWQDPRLR